MTARAGYALVAAAGAAAAAVGIAGMLGPERTLVVPWLVPLGGLQLLLDPLAGLFLALVGASLLPASLYAAARVGPDRRGLLAYGAFAVSLGAVPLAANVLTFALAWEGMSLASYFLVLTDRRSAEAPRAAWVYAVMTHAGLACLLAAMLLLGAWTGSLRFADWRAAAPALGAGARDLAFVLLALGFAGKAGTIPFHVWLPLAHPAAPSHVSALMSGVMIKLGVYGLARAGLDWLGPRPAWWGVALLLAGAVSAVVGVLYALVDHDLKRLLAFHSIENVGIIVIGLGAAMTYRAAGLDALAVLGLVAALYHTINHAAFKVLLFLGAGAVAHATGTRDMEQMGGLIRRMPWTAACFLVGAVAIAALPPLNGFVSEWLTFQALLQSMLLVGPGQHLAFALGLAGLALTGGLAMACFVKAFGITFLALPRSEAAGCAHEAAPAERVAMVGLAGACGTLGLGAAFVVPGLARIAVPFAGATAPPALGDWLTLRVSGDFASLSMPVVGAALLAAAGLALGGRSSAWSRSWGPQVIALDRVRDAVRAAGATDVTVGAGGAVDARLASGRLPALADGLGALGLEPQLVAAADTRAATGDFTLLHAFAPPTLRPLVTVRSAVAPAAPRFPSLARQSFTASRFEREIHDLFGLEPVGHPDLRRLALHQFWPAGYHPLRRDVPARADFADEGQPFPFRRVEGEGLFEITVGPVHAGIIEPGHFRFTVEGETIVNLETRLGFVHRGLEKLFERLPLERAPELAERISGDTSVGHALACCQALEALADCEVPPRARWLRMVLLELERLYNHVGDVGMIVNDTGFAFGHAHCFRLREELLRLNARLTGHRLLRGAVVPGGVTGPLAEATLGEAAARVSALAAEFEAVADLCLANMLVLERLQGTGRLTAATARGLGVTGLAGRASGLDADARRDAPFAAYGELDVRVAVYPTGDVWARTMVRIDEAREAARLIREAAARLPAGATRAPLGPLRAGDHALGIVEGWRGPIWHWVLAGPDNRLARVKIADPSFRNWPALEYAVLKNIVPDFPLCNKSFNLSYAGSDL